MNVTSPICSISLTLGARACLALSELSPIGWSCIEMLCERRLVPSSRFEIRVVAHRIYYFFFLARVFGLLLYTPGPTPETPRVLQVKLPAEPGGRETEKKKDQEKHPTERSRGNFTPRAGSGLLSPYSSLRSTIVN